MLKEIVEGNFEEISKLIKEINQKIDNAIKNKDEKTLRILRTELEKILKENF